MMNKITKLFLIGSASALAASCEHGETAATTDSAVEPLIEAVAARPGSLTASVEIGLKNNAPYFSASGFYYRSGNGGTSSGIVLNTGDVDLSSLPPGDATITIKLNQDAVKAGYRFPSQWSQAIAIAAWPAGQPNPPAPVFGTMPPGDFDIPVVAPNRQSVSFVDKDDDGLVYEYSVAVEGPGGRIVLDPRIKNGGVGNK